MVVSRHSSVRGNSGSSGRMMRKPTIRALAVLTAALSASVFAVAVANQAEGVVTCAGVPNVKTVLSGSNFEIDTDGNLKVDAASPCIDWLTGGAGTALRITPKLDKASGATDDSFGQGTSENDANPTIVAG